jgi:hypothetical protein
MLPDDWFTSSLQGSMIEQAVIGDLVESLLPEVAAHLQDLGVELSAITFGWILSLFANSSIPCSPNFRMAITVHGITCRAISHESFRAREPYR